jgi:hypothetical protein
MINLSQVKDKLIRDSCLKDNIGFEDFTGLLKR